MKNQLTETDLAMLVKAQQHVQQASAVWEFCKSHLATTYAIANGDAVDMTTGYITRSGDKVVAPEPVDTDLPTHPEMTD